MIIIVFAWAMLCAAKAIAQPPAPAAGSLRETIWNEACDAGTNIRYWSELADRASNIEWWARFWAIASGVFSFAFPLTLAPYLKSRKLKPWAWATVGVPELVGAVAFGYSLFQMLDKADEYKDLAAIHSRWATLARELDRLFAESSRIPQDKLEVRLDILQKQRQAIESIEPAGKDEALMHHSWVQEMHSRKVDPEYIAEVKKNRERFRLNPN